MGLIGLPKHLLIDAMACKQSVDWATVAPEVEAGVAGHGMPVPCPLQNIVSMRTSMPC
jgi:hypothetical protein